METNNTRRTAAISTDGPLLAPNSVRIGLATGDDADELVGFFANYSNLIAASAPSPEFMCSSGVRAAVRRRQMLIGKAERKIVAAARIYQRSEKGRISLYQFAVAEPYRGHGLLEKLLSFLGSARIEATCLSYAPINAFFAAAGWMPEDTGADRRIWTLEINLC